MSTQHSFVIASAELEQVTGGAKRGQIDAGMIAPIAKFTKGPAIDAGMPGANFKARRAPEPEIDQGMVGGNAREPIDSTAAAEFFHVRGPGGR